jgi:hypothetical protein
MVEKYENIYETKPPMAEASPYSTEEAIKIVQLES